MHHMGLRNMRTGGINFVIMQIHIMSRNNNLGCSHCKTSRHAQDFCYDLNGFPENTANVPKFEKYKQTKEKNPS